jgi:hypothetical protein
MAIYRRDRSFDNILRDVIADELPFRYVRHLEVELENGNVINWLKEDLEGFDNVAQVLAMNEGLLDNIVDIRIEVDFNDIEDDVSSRVSSLLGKNNDDD